MHFNRTYAKFAKLLLVFFPAVYLVTVFILRTTRGTDEVAPLPVHIDRSHGHTSFEEGDKVPLMTGHLVPIGGAQNNELSFRWFDIYDPRLKFSGLIPADEDKASVRVDSNSFASHFMRESALLRNSMVPIEFNHEVPIKAFDPIRYSPGEARFIDTLIRKGYGYSFYIDNQPVHFTISTDDMEKFNYQFLFSDNVPLGFIDRYNRAVLFNAYRFDITYRRKPDNRFTIVTATVHPLSMVRAHQCDEGFDIQDFVFLSESHVNKISWMYSIRFHSDDDSLAKQFTPKMALQLPDLAFYSYRYYVVCILLCLLQPFLIHAVTARYSRARPLGKHTKYSELPTKIAAGDTSVSFVSVVAAILATAGSVSVFALFTVLLWLIMASISGSSSLSYFIVAAAVSSPLLGFYLSLLTVKVAKMLGVPPSVTPGSDRLMAVLGFCLTVTLDFFALDMITHDVKVTSLMIYIVGVSMLVALPGTVLGSLIYSKQRKLKSTMEVEVETIETKDDKDWNSSSSTSRTSSSDSTNMTSLVNPQMSPIRAFAVVFTTIFTGFVPLCYPVSQVFFSVAYSIHFGVSNFALHSLFAVIVFGLTFYLSLRVILKKVTLGAIILYASISMTLLMIIFWSKFLQGFSVTNTNGGNLFLRKALVSLYRFFDTYDRKYFAFLTLNTAGAYSALMLAVLSVAICV